MTTNQAFWTFICAGLISCGSNLCRGDDFVTVRGQTTEDPPSSSTPQWVIPISPKKTESIQTPSETTPILNENMEGTPDSYEKENHSLPEPIPEKQEVKGEFVQKELQTPSNPPDAIPASTVEIPQKKESAKPHPQETEPSPTPAITAEGEIQHLDRKKLFVIIEFKIKPIPPAGSRFGVYRSDKQVGNIQLTEPIKPPYASADIISGSLQQGDIVHKL